MRAPRAWRPVGPAGAAGEPAKRCRRRAACLALGGPAIAATDAEHGGGAEQRNDLKAKPFRLRCAGDAAGGAATGLGGERLWAGAFDATGGKGTRGATGQLRGFGQALGGSAVIDPGADQLDFVGAQRGLTLGGHVLVFGRRER